MLRSLVGSEMCIRDSIYCGCSEAQIRFTFENLSRRTVHRRPRALFMRSCSLAFSDSRAHRSVSTARSLSLCSRGVLVRLLQFACCRYLVQHRGCSTLRHSSCIIYNIVYLVYIYCSCSEAQILFTFENLSRRTVHRRSRALFMRSCSLAFSDSRAHRSVSAARSLSLCSRGGLVRLLPVSCSASQMQHLMPNVHARMVP